MNSKAISKKIIKELDTGDVPELEFWKAKEVEGLVEDVLKDIKEQVKKRNQKWLNRKLIGVSSFSFH